MWLNFVGTMLILLAVGYFSPYGIRLIQQRRLRVVCGRKGILVLSYDDGPSRITTVRLLDLLSQLEAKATFFLVGKHVKDCPEVVKRLKADGHELASHSFQHLNAWKVSPWRSVRDVQQGFAALSTQQIDVRLFRPPYGKVNLLTWMATICRGIRFAWWTVVSGDTYAQLPDPVSIVRAVENEGGGIVLMHDFEHGEEHLTYVLDLTRRLLETARSRGWKVCTQGELQGTR